MLLLRSDSARWWSCDEVATSLRIRPALARSALSRLVDRGLCQAGVSQRELTKYAPSQSEVETAVDMLAWLYREQRIEVLVFISRAAIARVRHDALRTFAEAFRILDHKKHK